MAGQVLEEAVLAEEVLVGRERLAHPVGEEDDYGDCFAYALANVLGQPLLYQGDDFQRADVTPFLPPDGPRQV